MDNHASGPARRHLLIEVSSGTAILDGVRVELPPREFKLLTELATRPGDPVAAADLVAAVWPDVTWDVSQELYVLISRLRKLIGDDGARLLKNRRGFGYYLALPDHEVVVAKTLEVVKAGRTATGVPAEPAAASPPPAPRVPAPAIELPTRARAARPRYAVAAAAAVGLALGSIAAAFVLEERVPVTVVEQQGSDAGETPAPVDGGAPDASRGRRDDDGRTKAGGRNAGNKRTRDPVVVTRLVAAPASGSGGAAATLDETDRSPDRTATRDEGEQRVAQPAPRDLPAAPTTPLYHMYNDETGDHLMTTSAAQATSYQNRGYAGTSIGRVYTSAREGTTRIATDFESAYIFSSITAETAPASQLTALWYATNGRGDFFYTTRQADGAQPGWSAQHVGYIRTA